MILNPRNWQEFQHYKDRSPPWIKMHKTLLTDRDYMTLPLASLALAPLLWLLASESKDGTFNASTDELSFRLHLPAKTIEEGRKHLISKGFFIVAGGVLADGVQGAIPEGEIEEKVEVEVKNKKPLAVRPDNVSPQVWDDFLTIRKAKRAPLTVTSMNGIIKQAMKAGISIEDALITCCKRGWVGFEAGWMNNIKGQEQQGKSGVEQWMEEMEAKNGTE